MSIQILPDEVASQIAAGEVVERPASVVKELLENALDAGATSIQISIQQAGKRLIEITDDGSGIPASELPLALARHATSKLRTAQDLFHIRTLGFRGEALASIGSVAHMTVTSRPKAETLGARMAVDGGKFGETNAVGAPAGTNIRVEDLFYNVPARLKFLKQDQTERQQIDALVTRYALAYPNTRFQLLQDSRPSIQTSGNGNQREILAQLYGPDVARQLLEVDFLEEDITIHGFISPVALTRSNRREITFFINGRWVSDIALSTALIQAYHTLLMVGRFPMGVLFIQLDPEDVDVNVHPAKAEVRFRHADRVFSAVTRAAKRALLAYSPVPSVAPASAWGGGAGAWSTPLSIAYPEALTAPEPMQGSLELDAHEEIDEQENEPGRAPATPLPSGQLPLLRLIGQVGATYLVAEGPDGIYLIDQHAAHERVLFEKMLNLGWGKIPSQALLAPTLFQLPPESARLLSNQLHLLADLGFQVESFGPNTFRILAIPAFMTGIDPESAVKVVVEDFEEDETPLQAELENRLAARICKRVAVKGGKVLSPEEQRALIKDLEACRSPRTCPHGRPTMIHLSVDLLERQFGRRGAR